MLDIPGNALIITRARELDNGKKSLCTDSMLRLTHLIYDVNSNYLVLSELIFTIEFTKPWLNPQEITTREKLRSPFLP